MFQESKIQTSGQDRGAEEPADGAQRQSQALQPRAREVRVVGQQFHFQSQIKTHSSTKSPQSSSVQNQRIPAILRN